MKKMLCIGKLWPNKFNHEFQRNISDFIEFAACKQKYYPDFETKAKLMSNTRLKLQI